MAGEEVSMVAAERLRRRAAPLPFKGGGGPGNGLRASLGSREANGGDGLDGGRLVVADHVRVVAAAVLCDSGEFWWPRERRNRLGF